jgi:hypothetical protein
MKDIYTIVFNPDNIFFKHELWMKGEVEDIRTSSGHHEVFSKMVVKKIGSYRNRSNAELKQEYYEALQEFKLGE